MSKVSVYMPCYNYGQFIEKAIQSVLAQAFSDWELIVINDGSTDDSINVLQQFSNHPKIEIINQENKGLNATNNVALKHSKGEYIIRLDADDYFDENILLVLSNILDSYPDVGLVYPDYYNVDKEGSIIEMVRSKKVYEEVELLDLPAHGACTMIRKKCLIEVGGYSEKFSCQDGYDIWLKMIRRYKAYNVNIPLFYYRQHGENLTTKQARILDTRRKIKRHFLETNNHCLPKVMGVIPVATNNIDPKRKPFIEIAGHPLLWYTLKEVIKVKSLDRIILSTDNQSVIDYGKQFQGIETFFRPSEYSISTLNIKDLVHYLIMHFEDTDSYCPDYVCIMYITTPLRRAKHIEKAIDTMCIFNVDSVISVVEERSYCYQHSRYGLTPINGTKRGIKIELDTIYKENSAIYLTSVDVIKKGMLLGKTVGHIVMLPEESIKVNSPFEFWMAEEVLSKMDKERDP